MSRGSVVGEGLSPSNDACYAVGVHLHRTFFSGAPHLKSSVSRPNTAGAFKQTIKLSPVSKPTRPKSAHTRFRAVSQTRPAVQRNEEDLNFPGPCSGQPPRMAGISEIVVNPPEQSYQGGNTQSTAKEPQKRLNRGITTGIVPREFEQHKKDQTTANQISTLFFYFAK